MKNKKIVRNSLIIGLLIILVNIVTLEVFTRKVLIPNDIIFRKEQMLMEKQEHIKMVSLGDSHGERGMDIDRPDFFNLSIASEPVPIWYFKTKWLVENLEKLEVILLPMDYHIFSYYRTSNIEHVTRQYKDYIDETVDPELGIYPDPNKQEKFPLYSLQSNYAPIAYMTLGQYLIGSLDKPELTENGTSPRGGRFIDNSPEKRQQETKIRVNEHLYNRFLVHPQMVDYYKKIIELGQKNNIEVILVRYPLTNDYIDHVNEEVEKEFTSVLQDIQREYELKVLDYRSVFKNKQQLFRDQDHLNDIGAKEFGKLVSKDVSRLDGQK